MKLNLLTPRNFGNDVALLLLRLTVGILMLFNHGYGKVERLAGDESVKFMDFMGLGPQLSLGLVAFAEAACSVLIIPGLLFRFALIPLIITMLVVLFKAHAGDPFKEVELPVFFLLVYISLFITGPGKYSVDSRWK